MEICTRKRIAWMMETKMGILARTPEEERAGDCDAALSSGVVEVILFYSMRFSGVRRTFRIQILSNEHE
jgi:hypothetical protein